MPKQNWNAAIANRLFGRALGCEFKCAGGPHRSPSSTAAEWRIRPGQAPENHVEEAACICSIQEGKTEEKM